MRSTILLRAAIAVWVAAIACIWPAMAWADAGPIFTPRTIIEVAGGPFVVALVGVGVVTVVVISVLLLRQSRRQVRSQPNPWREAAPTPPSAGGSDEPQE